MHLMLTLMKVATQNALLSQMVIVVYDFRKADIQLHNSYLKLSI